MIFLVSSTACRLAYHLYSLQVLGQADFVVEAINECETSKKAAFLLLDRVSLPSLLLAPWRATSIPGIRIIHLLCTACAFKSLKLKNQPRASAYMSYAVSCRL